MYLVRVQYSLKMHRFFEVVCTPCFCMLLSYIAGSIFSQLVKWIDVISSNNKKDDSKSKQKLQAMLSFHLYIMIYMLHWLSFQVIIT